MDIRQLRGWLLRLLGVFHRQQREREFAEELESHLAFHHEDNLRAGMSPEEAQRVALVKLGGVAQIKELHREQGGLLKSASPMRRKRDGQGFFPGGLSGPLPEVNCQKGKERSASGAAQRR